jgi:hypothetical protein
MKPPIFIASSTEGLDLAYAAQINLEHFAAPTVWSQGVFQASSIVLDQLIKSLDAFSFGIFVFSPDDLIFMRGQERSVPRDNVVFELGLFIGRLGRARNFVIVPRGQRNLKLPTDLLGLTTVDYDETRHREEYQAALGPACHRIQLAIRAVTDLDASGGDIRHKGANILYSSRSTAHITDFVAYGDRFFGEGRDKPRAVGSFRLQNGILIIERSNTAGRFLAELRQYRIGDQVREYIPRNDLVAGRRIFTLTCEVKSTRGARKAIFVLKHNSRGDRLAEHPEVVTQNDWSQVEAALRTSPFEDCYLRIEDLELTDSNSSLHIRDLILSEKAS